MRCVMPALTCLSLPVQPRLARAPMLVILKINGEGY
jgi:hypothetical protein